MNKQFDFSIMRFYGVLEESQDYEILAEDEKDALLLAVADLGDLYAYTADEAKQKAQDFLDEELGKGWTVRQFLESDIELWTIDRICYQIRNVSQHDARSRSAGFA